MKNVKKTNQYTERERKDNVKVVAFLSIVVVVIIAALIYSSGLLESLMPGDHKINMETGKTVTGVAELDPDIDEQVNISYPGQESISLKADTKKQDVYFSNPADNTCYFQINLVLKNGTTIWKSDYLEPGNAFDRIELKKALKEGVYDATLKYKSYSLKDERQQNGASMAVRLIVE